MNLVTDSITLNEIAETESRFPSSLRAALCRAVETIAVEELEQLRSKHESEPDNFDGRIEAALREMAPDLTIRADCRISDATKFNNDLLIESNDCLICLEIEKSSMARFELDVLKMQAFATRWRSQRPELSVFGAFIVPTDTVVARHISGNSNESSYAYLKRLARLLGQIDPLGLDDVLFIGYGVADPIEMSTRQRTSASRSELLSADAGLLPDEDVRAGLQGYPTELIFSLRRALALAQPTLQEKFNPNSRYLGYAAEGRGDAVYVYVQRKRLVIDLRVSAELADDLRDRGFQVSPRNNFQGRAGWLTGLIVPHDTRASDQIISLMQEALQGE